MEINNHKIQSQNKILKVWLKNKLLTYKYLQYEQMVPQQGAGMVPLFPEFSKIYNYFAINIILLSAIWFASTNNTLIFVCVNWLVLPIAELFTPKQIYCYSYIFHTVMPSFFKSNWYWYRYKVYILESRLIRSQKAVHYCFNKKAV